MKIGIVKWLCSILSALFLVSGVPAPAQDRGSSSDQTEVKEFRLDADRLTKFGDAAKAMTAYANENKSLRDAVQQDQTILGTVRTIEKYPQIVLAIQKAGLTTREFAVMGMALVSSVMVVAMKKQGLIKEIPPAVSAENVAFIEQNYDKVESLMKNLQSDK